MMQTKAIQQEEMHLFIIGYIQPQVDILQNYLTHKFGKLLSVTAFNEFDFALQNLDSTTNFVVINYQHQSVEGNFMMERIYKKNPNAAILILPSNEDVSNCIQAFLRDKSDLIMHTKSLNNKATHFLFGKRNHRIRIFKTDYNLSSYMTMFLVTFFVMGLVALIMMKVVFGI